MEKIKKIKIKRINVISNEDVYDITVENNHNFFANNILVHNCGEITLSDCDSCRLMVINLFSYVNNPFTSSAKFDYDLFSTHVRLLTKMMDNMIDLELEKIDKIINKIESDPEDEETKAIELNLWKKIKKSCELGRRAGIGITGEGDMLAAMGLTYGTPEATEFSKYVQNLLALNAYIESCDLVQQENRPRFGCYNYELEKNNQFLLRLSYINNSVSDPYLHKILNNFIVEFKEKWTNGKGRRNIALLTVAPTGCCDENQIIQFDNMNNLKMGDIFKLNNIDIEYLKTINARNLWFEPVHNMFTKGINNKSNKITKLYWNGLSDGKKIILSDKQEINCSNEHKLLVKTNTGDIIWKCARELNKTDMIVIKK